MDNTKEAVKIKKTDMNRLYKTLEKVRQCLRKLEQKELANKGGLNNGK